jgi:hypothetical protein
MDCARVRELLSEYIDDVLDPETRARVEKHLDGCKACTEELTALQALVEELGTLEKIQPPDDFLDRLHERLTPHFSLQKLVQLFFVPIRVKLPLEFATAAFLVILIYASLQGPGLEKHMAGTPEGSEPVQLAKKAPPSVVAPKPKKAAEEGMPALDRVTVEPSKAESTVARDAFPKTQPGYGAHEPTAPPESAYTAEGAEKGMAREQELADTGQFEVSTATGSTEGENLGETVTQIEGLVQRVHGSILSLDKDPKTGNPRSLTVDIPQDKYETFSTELKRLTDPAWPPPAILHKRQETLRMKITLATPPEKTS